MKKILCVILAVFIAAAFVSCSQGGSGTEPAETGSGAPVSGEDVTGTGEPDETTIYYEPDELPELDFGGEKIVILTIDGTYFKNEIFSEELTSDPVTDSVFNREKYVEDRLGVDLSPVYRNKDEYNETVNIQNASGDNSYQLFAEDTVYYVPVIFDNCLVNLYDLDYLDLSKPWWSPLFTEEADIGGNLFIATGSLALSVNKFKYVMYYNKKLAEDYKSVYPELDDIYSVVVSGDWTYDKLVELTSDIYEDVNGNSERDDEDVYGFGINTNAPIDTVWSSFDMRILGRDEDGWPVLDYNQDKIFKVLEMMQDLIHRKNGTFIVRGTSVAPLEEKFASGTLLFMEGHLMSSETVELRNMQDDYGLIPFPKYDRAQSEYYSYAWDQYVSFSIPRTNPEPNTAAAVLEAMASYSYRETVPIYLDVALKGKYMSDAKSRRMVDIIVNGFRIDGGWIYSSKIGYFAQGFRDAVKDNSTSYGSGFTKDARTAKIGLSEIKSRFSKLWNGE